MVLENGDKVQLHAHLSQYTQEELKPLRVRRKHPERRPFFPALAE